MIARAGNFLFVHLHLSVSRPAGFSESGARSATNRAPVGIQVKVSLKRSTCEHKTNLPPARNQASAPAWTEAQRLKRSADQSRSRPADGQDRGERRGRATSASPKTPQEQPGATGKFASREVARPALGRWKGKLKAAKRKRANRRRGRSTSEHFVLRNFHLSPWAHKSARPPLPSAPTLLDSGARVNRSERRSPAAGASLLFVCPDCRLMGALVSRASPPSVRLSPTQRRATSARLDCRLPSINFAAAAS